MVSALAEAKQIQEVLGEYGDDSFIIIETGSSAAKANAERPGSGKMKHISVKYRYLQEAVQNQEVKIHKIGTKNNVADGLTKGVNQDILGRMLAALNIELENGTFDINMITAVSEDGDQVGEDIYSNMVKVATALGCVVATSMCCRRRPQASTRAPSISSAIPATSAAASTTVTVGTQTETHMFWDEAQLRVRYMQKTTAQLENDIRARGLSLPGVKQTKRSLENTLLLDDLSRVVGGSAHSAVVSGSGLK